MNEQELADHQLVAQPQVLRVPKKHGIEHLLWGLCRVSSWFSTYSLERFAYGLAFFCFDILRIRRKIILRNLDIAFRQEKSAKEKKRIGRLSVYHFILTIIEFFRSPYHDIAAQVEMRKREHIDHALSQGRGAYIICFHMGNWEAHSPAVTRQVKPVHIVVKKVGSYAVNRFVETLRKHNRFLWIKREKKGDAFQAMKSILQKNEIVGFVFDQARPGEPRLPFFGSPAKTNTSFAAIRQRMPAPVITSYARRIGLGRHIVEYGPELQFAETDDPSQDIINHSKQINLVIENIIKQHPEHYFWFHNRWK